MREAGRSRALEEIAERAKEHAQVPIAVTQYLDAKTVRSNQEQAIDVDGDNAAFHMLGAILLGGFGLFAILSASNQPRSLSSDEEGLVGFLVTAGVAMILWYAVAQRQRVGAARQRSPLLSSGRGRCRSKRADFQTTSRACRR